MKIQPKFVKRYGVVGRHCFNFSIANKSKYIQDISHLSFPPAKAVSYVSGAMDCLNSSSEVSSNNIPNFLSFMVSSSVFVFPAD